MLLTRDKGFYRELILIALPLAAENAVRFLMTLADNLMVGRLGDMETGAAYCGMQISSAFVMLIAGIEGGMLVGSAQQRGSGNKRAAGRTALFGISTILILGALMSAASFLFPEVIVSPFLHGRDMETAAEYLRALAFSFIPTALSGAIGTYLKCIERPIGCTVSAIGALLAELYFGSGLIFGAFGMPRLGAIGSAAAFSIAKGVETLLLSVFALRYLRASLKENKKAQLKAEGRASAKEYLGFLSLTSPILLGQAVWIFNTLFSAFVIGRLNSGAEFAAFAIANTLNAVTYIIPNALSVSLGLKIGKTVGEGDMRSLKSFTYTAEVIFIAIGAVSAISLGLIAKPFVSLYGVSDEARRVAVSLIRVLSVTTAATTFGNALVSGTVRAGGDTSFILKNDSAFIFLAVIPLSLVALKLGAPVWLTFLALKCDHILKCIPAAFRIHGFRWVRPVVKAERGRGIGQSKNKNEASY
ncbi:MAG: hypothetical protein IJY18_02180 [Clostridia bacterium]|nr:hypothetical protein [Clostridia bacterium]